jgi:hypothetical protein
VIVTALPGATAGSLLWRWHGRLHVTAVLKATFAFAADGRPMTPVAPLAVVERDVLPSPGKPHLRASELAPLLSAVDVLVTGHASSPPGKHEAGFEVWRGAERVLGKTVELPSAGASRLPIGPLGIGPIARAAPGRRNLLGHLEPAALEREVVELPNDVEWSFFHAAPADQRLRRLHGDERLVLRCLHATAPRLEMGLPRVSASARVMAGDRALGAVSLVADMLVVDADRGVCSLVWRGHVPVEGPERLRVVASVEHGTPKAAVARTMGPDPKATVMLGDYFGHVVGAAASAPPATDDLLATTEVAPAGAAALKQDETLPGAAKRDATLPFRDDAAPTAPPRIDPMAPVDTGTLSDTTPARGRRSPAVTPFPLATPRAEAVAPKRKVAKPADPLLETRWLSPADASRMREEPTTPFVAGTPQAPPPAPTESGGSRHAGTELHVTPFRPMVPAVPFSPPRTPSPTIAGVPPTPPPPTVTARSVILPTSKPAPIGPPAPLVEQVELDGPAGAFLGAAPIEFAASDEIPGP